MKNEEFHKPFIKSLILTAVVTLVSLLLVDLFFHSSSLSSSKSEIYASDKIQSQPNQ